MNANAIVFDELFGTLEMKKAPDFSGAFLFYSGCIYIIMDRAGIFSGFL